MRLAPCSVKEARRWVKRVHRHLPDVQGGLFAAKVVDESGTRAVALAGFAARVWNDTGRILISRVASDGAENACSMLYGSLCRAAKALGYREAWTYTLPEEPGTSLRAAGFEDMGLSDGGEHDRPSRRRAPAKRPEPKRRWRRVLTTIPALLLIAFAGCAHLPGLGPSKEFPLACVSRCGARLIAPPGVYQAGCREFDKAEARVVAAFPSREVCRKLNGAIVSMQATESWDIDTRHVAGVTRCERNSIQVGSAPWRKGAFAHEVRHLIECPIQDVTHETWTLADWLALDAANAPSPEVMQ